MSADYKKEKCFYCAQSLDDAVLLKRLDYGVRVLCRKCRKQYVIGKKKEEKKNGK